MRGLALAFILLLIVIVTGSTQLPVTLVSFEAEEWEGSVRLKWETSMEDNVSHFAIQWSRNASFFFEIDKVMAANQPNTYQYEDPKPKEINYYRLAIVDRDGSVEFSEVRTVYVSGVPTYRFPNPIIDSMYFGDSDVIIYDLLGRLQTVEDVYLLPAGVYFLISDERTIKIIKQ